jgi:hypothetical protein
VWRSGADAAAFDGSALIASLDSQKIGEKKAQDAAKQYAGFLQRQQELDLASGQIEIFIPVPAGAQIATSVSEGALRVRSKDGSFFETYRRRKRQRV